MKETYALTLTSIDSNGFTPWFQIDAPTHAHSKITDLIKDVAMEKDMHVEFLYDKDILYFRSREGKYYTLRNCEGCGKLFFAVTRRNTRCKKGCGRKPTNRNKSRDEQRRRLLSTPRYCPVCSQEFIPSTKRQKYCSKTCSRKHWKEQNQETSYYNPQLKLTEE